MSAYSDMISKNITLMNSLESFDVVIICCGNSAGAKYWQSRLTKGKGSVIAENTIVLAVHEDWPGGAGNALGTLYAYQNASKLAKAEFGLEMDEKLRSGEISVALYHTAGKGTRMAPLPGAENNNKPGVKLPANVDLEGKPTAVTILESVVKQTGCYAKSRRGRLSVFWGDQTEWAEKGMDKYGLIALTCSGKAAQVEKVTHAQAMELLQHLDTIESVGASLGSFSVSSNLLFALLQEFSADLAAKEGKLDSDPHLWMPFTLERGSYLGVIMASMLEKFNADETNSGLGIFGPVDVGQSPCWWDYGQLKLYSKFSKMMIDNTEESGFMRSFFRVSDSDRKAGSQLGETSTDDVSVVSMCDISSGNIKDSILINVHCKNIDASGCIIMNVTADSIVARADSIIYNRISTDALVADEGVVSTGVTTSDGTQVIINSKMSIDGGKAWDEKVGDNEYTFGEVHGKVNADADPSELESVNTQLHAAARRSVK
eukprot:GSChrysophyteH1.ASY1.ANO1.1619.1 assembled CDS